MVMDIDTFRYHKSPLQGPYPYKDSESWGKFVRYLELGDDGYAVRQVDEFENGRLTRYDRVHWDGRFGTLASLRFGAEWKDYWGLPVAITSQEFEDMWTKAGESPAILEGYAADGPPPWIKA